MADFGEILETIGDFGLFQKLLLFALCFPNLILPFQLSSLVFNHADTNHHCNTDWILQVGPNLTKEEQLNLTLPRLPDGSFDPCQMYVPVDWDLSAIWEYGLNETTTCTDGWVHNDTIYDSTIVTDVSNLGLVTCIFEFHVLTVDTPQCNLATMCLNDLIMS